MGRLPQRSFPGDVLRKLAQLAARCARGFDEDTAAEIQARAQEYLARIEAEQEARRKELGVADELKEIEGVTTPMLVAFGENDVKTLEDLAGCATDDSSAGPRAAEPRRFATRAPSTGSRFPHGRGGHVMAARVKAGWIEAPVAGDGGREADEAPARSRRDLTGHATRGQRLPRQEPERTCIVTRAVARRGADPVRPRAGARVVADLGTSCPAGASG